MNMIKGNLDTSFVRATLQVAPLLLDVFDVILRQFLTNIHFDIQIQLFHSSRRLENKQSNQVTCSNSNSNESIPVYRE